MKSSDSHSGSPDDPRASDVDFDTVPAEMPSMPELPDPITADAMAAWIEEVTPLMATSSDYRKRLSAARDRHEFRKTKSSRSEP